MAKDYVIISDDKIETDKIPALSQEKEKRIEDIIFNAIKESL